MADATLALASDNGFEPIPRSDTGQRRAGVERRLFSASRASQIDAVLARILL
jgi:hypothetical protein